MRVRRWVALDPETDDKLRDEAKKEDRSIANMIKNIVTKYLNGAK